MTLRKFYIIGFNSFQAVSLILFLVVTKLFSFDIDIVYVSWVLLNILFFNGGFYLSQFLPFINYFSLKAKNSNFKYFFFLASTVLILNCLEYLNFYVKYGVFPIFSANPDEAILSISINGSFHLLARSSFVIIPLFLLEFSDRIMPWIIFILLVILHALGGERSVVLFYVLPIIFKFLIRKINVISQVSLFVVGLFFLGYLKYLREGTSMEMVSSLEALGLDSVFMRLSYFIFGTIGFEHFISHGYFTNYSFIQSLNPTNFSFIHPLLSPVMNISDPLNFQNDFFGTDSKFYLTSGFFGVFFIDYFKYSFLVLFFVGLFFGYMLKTWEFHKSLIIVVFFSVSLYDYIFVYTYPWIYFIILYLIPTTSNSSRFT